MSRTKKGRLFLRTHEDCFLHATRGWLSYWPVSLSSEKLMLVRVTLPDGHHFLTTLSPNPLSYNSVWKGVSRERYLEIDTSFAKQLGITAPNIEVAVEVVEDIERCTDLYLEPVHPDDLEKLESNHGKIEYELLNRIRVVSGQSFTFPIWIDSVVVPVRVVSSEPAAKWVLLGSDETGARGERATVVRFKGAPSPSNSTSSSYTSPTGSVKADDSSDHLSGPSFSVRKDLLCATGMVSGSEGSSPESNIDNVSVSSSASSKLFELLWRPFFNVTSTQRSLAPEDSDRSSTRTPEPAVSAPPTFLQPQETQFKHKKTKSWSHPTDPGFRLKLPKYVETPSMDTLLRVQPHSIGGPDKYSMKNGGQSSHGPPQWEYSRLFDVYVHPSTFPEISNYYHSSKNLGSFLVQVKSANPPKASSQSQGNQNEIHPPQPPQSADPAGADTNTITSPISETRLELARLFSTIAELSSPAHDTESDTSDSSSKSATSQPLTFAKTLVLRLCFATKLISCEDSRVCPLPHPPSSDPGELSESQLDCKEVLRVAPGHIVMSHIVQQQLQTGACSLVRVSHVSDEGRLPASKGQVTLHIRPLDMKASILLEHRHKLESSMKSWVVQVRKNNPFGAVLVNNQILPLLDYSDSCCYCSIEVVSSNPKPRGSQRPLSYLMMTPQDYTPSRVTARVKITVDTSQSRPLNELSIPPIEKLNPLPIALNPKHFGAFDDLITRGSVFLRSALLQCQRHKPKGRLLISGTAGDAGLLCGKTSLAQLIVQKFTSHPTYAHVQLIDCTTFRVQTVVRVGKRIGDIFEMAVNCQPAVVILDNLHNAMPRFQDVEEQTSGEGFLSLKKVQVLMDQLSALDRTADQVLVVATTKSREDLHPTLLHSRGSHVFEETLEIPAPDLAGREAILNAVMESKAVFLDTELKQIALKTEGFQVGDLVKVVDRAISCVQIRNTCPEALNTAASSPVTKRHSKIFDDVGSGGGTSPLTTRSLPSSPLRKHHQLKNVKSLSPPLNQKRRSVHHINLSTLTLVERTQNYLEFDQDGRMKLTERDFRVALNGFVPLTLHGLSLHSTGSIDFSRVGGMKGIKKVLRETILWPSKYPKLFTQCPIRMCRGVLLYGLPGTGKTLLASAIAKEFGLNFISVKGPEILSKYIGASEQAVRDLFVRAQAAKPCVLFFDEFDSLAPKRGQDRTGVTDRVVNQLLTQLDGVESLEGVYMVAATSRPDMIDPALLRPGRIDKSILCNYPNEDERLEILKALSRDMSLQNAAGLSQIAHGTENYTGADLKALLYSAQLRAVHRALEEDRTDLKTSSTNVETTTETVDVKEPAPSRVMVYRLSDPRCTGTQAEAELEQRAVTLQTMAMERAGMATLKHDIHGGGDERRQLYITREDLTEALKDIKPSVSSEERQRFTEIYDRFTGKVPQSLKDVLNQRSTMA